MEHNNIVVILEHYIKRTKIIKNRIIKSKKKLLKYAFIDCYLWNYTAFYTDSKIQA